MPDCLVLGAAAMDVFVQVPRFAQADEIIFPDAVRRLPGGSGANVAAAMACLGISTAFAGTVGEDDAGKEILQAFQKVGVDCRYISTVMGKNSGGAFIAVNPQGERLMYSLGGTALIMEPDNLEEIPFEQFHSLYVGESMPEVALRAMKRMKAAGGRVYFGPGGMYCSAGKEALSKLLPLTDMLFLSIAELHMLEAGGEYAEVLYELRQKVKQIVLTCGAQGARCICQDSEIYQPAFPVQSFDTTGAGDAFAAGMIAGITRGKDIPHALELAAACAALTITAQGARAGVSLAGAERFLREQGVE